MRRGCPCLVLIHSSYALLEITFLLETFAMEMAVVPPILHDVWRLCFHVGVRYSCPSLGKADVILIWMLGFRVLSQDPQYCELNDLHAEVGFFHCRLCGSWLFSFEELLSHLKCCCLRVSSWNRARHAQICILLGAFMVHSQAKPWVNPAIYWLLLDLIEMLWSQDLTGQGENLNTNETESRDPRVNYL